MEELEMVGRLGLAAFLGGMIGLEREMHSQSAGLRTHMVVAVGAALIMLVSIHVAQGSPGQGDPSRIAAQVVSGIGFLGAGAILRFGMSVKGLTTAACLWTAAGIGLAVGCGYIWGAVAATGFVLLAIFVFDRIERFFIVGKTTKRFTITAADTPGMMGKIEALMEKHRLLIRQVGLNKDLVEKKIQIAVTAVAPRDANMEDLSGEISSQAGVERLEID
ncbi:MAG: hypothetical protein A2Z34_10895 [Planctomycetes bacterium RBG_16_59_8]|nr:MAG: hypothetical protein A2Z34_10895 [Planctomycetes bacterium RBG_16_59_8]